MRSATGCYTGYGTISQTQQKEGAGKRIRIIDLFHGITAMRRNSLKPVGTDRSLYLSLHRFCCYWTLRTSNFKTGSNRRRRPFQGCLATRLTGLESAQMIDENSLTV